MNSHSYTLSDIATFLSADFKGDADYKLSSVATLQSASPGQLSFLANSRYQKYLRTTQAGAVILSQADLENYTGNAVISDDPYLAYAKISHLFSPIKHPLPEVSPAAFVHPTAVIGNRVSVAAGAHIAQGCVIGDGVVIGANTVIGEGSIVVDNSVINPNVTIYHDVHIGARCLVHSGVVLGADGFGFAQEDGEWVKIAQLGGVRIGNDVEIGAGTTIDRGALEHTVIEDGVILDNQIQIAHNVTIGKNSALAACTAVAGSTKIGAQCTIAGACGITGHLSIADGSHITAMSLITKSILKPGVYSSGTGMLPNKIWKKNVVRFRQLDKMARRIKSIEDEIVEIKGS